MVRKLSGSNPFFPLQAGTNKVSRHNFQTMYTKYFEQSWPGIDRKEIVKKLFEIGFGCEGRSFKAQVENAGKSAHLWRNYFPSAEIWYAEYNTACLAAWQDRLLQMSIKTVSGDQGDPATLKEWVATTGGNFDVIIDDGGHQNHQIYNTFLILFDHALKPGGLYIVEDLMCSRIETRHHCRTFGVHKNKSIMDPIKDWIEELATWTTQDHRQNPAVAYTPKYKMPPNIKSIECFSEVCAIVKCYSGDPACAYGAYVEVNSSMWSI